MIWFYIILIIVLVVLYKKFYKEHKNIKTNSIMFVSGAPKTGKSLLTIYKCYVEYMSALKTYFIGESLYILTFGILGCNDRSKMPLFYSNIPVNFGYCVMPVTYATITRRVKIRDHSVVYLGEFSLVANSRIGQNSGVKNGVDYDLINEQLLLFTKLSGHQFNGFIGADSQVISDCHYSLKRVLSNNIYIHHNISIPFFKVLFVRELMYSEDNNNLNVTEEDSENKLKWLIVPKRFFKYYDFRCYSVLSDNLEEKNNITYFENLKCDKIVSYSKFKTISKEVLDYEEKD